jgi:hypothetical protein
MKQNRILAQTALILILIFSTFQILWATGEVKVGFGSLQGYAIRPKMMPKSGFNTQLFSRKDQFDEYYAPVAGKKAGKLDFNRFVVLVCQSAPTMVETTLKLDKLVKVNGVLEVHFSATYGAKRKDSYAPVCMYTTAVDKSLASMVYYLNGKVVQDLRN